MPYPINYDFAKNWNSKIVPHLDNPKIKSAIKKGVNDYLAMYPLCNRKYKPNTPPATYSSCDGYCTLMDRLYDETLEAAKENNMLPKELVAIEKEIRESPDVDDDDLNTEWFRIREKLYNYLFSWENIKHSLESYILLRSCHWWAPTFELQLARLVEPKEKWYVREGNKHSTVINKNHTKIFDILYWSCRGRLENYIFGDPVKNPDPTLGGKDAYLDSEYDSEYDSDNE